MNISWPKFLQYMNWGYIQIDLTRIINEEKIWKKIFANNII